MGNREALGQRPSTCLMRSRFKVMERKNEKGYSHRRVHYHPDVTVAPARPNAEKQREGEKKIEREREIIDS